MSVAMNKFINLLGCSARMTPASPRASFQIAPGARVCDPQQRRPSRDSRISRESSPGTLFNDNANFENRILKTRHKTLRNFSPTTTVCNGLQRITTDYNGLNEKNLN
jgi:hypothetical protein